MHRIVAVLAVLSLIAGPLCAHFGVIPPLVGFGIYALAGLLGLIALLWSVVGFIRKRGRPGLINGLIGLACAAAVAVPAIQGRGYPPINDISTDLADPPALSNAPAYPDSFVPIVREHYPTVTSLRLDGVSPQIAFDEAVVLAQAREGWAIEGVDRRAMTFEGVARTRLFQFRDDFVVRVQSRDGETIVDMRSRSRDGKGDLGANARRIQAFFTDLNARLAGGARD